jgi:hypothetical protein
MFHARCLLVLAIVLVTATSSARAQKSATDRPTLVIELNTLKPADGNCRIAFVIENRLGVAIRNLSFELVLFDKSQRILSLLSVAAGAFPKGKTRVKLFDIEAVGCDTVARALLNDITQCDGDGLTAASCLHASVLRSRTQIPFAS